jgi:hypothetical protein
MRLRDVFKAVEAGGIGGGAGSGDFNFSAPEVRNLGQPVLGSPLLITPEFTVEGSAVVEVTAYIELTNEGGWWTPGLLHNGASVWGDDGNPLGGAVALPADVFGYVAFTPRGVMTGVGYDAPAAPPNGRGAHAGEPLAVSQDLASTGNLIVLPSGTHRLALGIAPDLNDGSHAAGSPDVVTRNVAFSVRVIR